MYTRGFSPRVYTYEELPRACSLKSIPAAAQVRFVVPKSEAIFFFPACLGLRAILQLRRGGVFLVWGVSRSPYSFSVRAGVDRWVLIVGNLLVGWSGLMFFPLFD